MATDKPRITITLEPEQYAVLHRMAKVQGGSMSRIVTDLLGEVAPVLGRVADAMEAAQKAQQGMKATIRAATEQAERDMQPLVATVLGQFDHFATQLERLSIPDKEPSPGADARGAGRVPARTRAPAAATARGPRPVITGATNPNGRGKGRPKGCTCTITKHERMESKTCPVHARIHAAGRA